MVYFYQFINSFQVIGFQDIARDQLRIDEPILQLSAIEDLLDRNKRNTDQLMENATDCS